MNGRILIVEDDAVIAGLMSDCLVKWGYETECVTDFSDIMPVFARYAPQLVLLDVTLPFKNGYYWCGEIRKVSSVPVVFVSSAGDNLNIVMAMNMGGDDFISKPFDLEVLSAKIRAVMRRAYSYAARGEIIEHNGVVLDTDAAAVVWQDRREILSKNEFRILKILFENAGSVVSRETIMQKLWASESFIDDNTLTVNITRLRRRLEDMGISDIITTRKGQGYMVD